MGLIAFSESRFQSIRSSLVSHAIERPAFRDQLWDALHTCAIDPPDVTPAGMTRYCSRFASGLWRANRVLVAHRHGPQYKGTPALSDGGAQRSISELMQALEAVEYNAITPLPDDHKERFSLKGWGGHPEHARRVFQPVSLAVADLWSRVERDERTAAPALA